MTGGPVAAAALPLVLAAALAAAAAGAARADAPLWELGLGAGALRLPHYRGAEQSHTWLLPVPYFVYRGPILRADREGARAVLLERGGVEVDLSLAASAPTRSRDNRARDGMPDLAPTIELGPVAQWRLGEGAGWKLELRAPLRAVATLEGRPRHIGWTASPHLNLDLRWRGWDVGLLAGTLWGDRRLHGYFYDVAPAFATAARPAYRARGGGAGSYLTLGASRRIGDVWLGAFVRADRLDGAVFEASPLVRRRDNLAFGLAASWIFARSAAQVPEVD
jgi:outer membrane scaffolding protein for murein synthesis (MipA/OmpV family)